MSQIIVGKIQEFDVIYIPERDCVFCKNTAIPVSVMKDALKSPMDRYEIPNKNLTILLSNDTITLGCLSTTRDNCKNISRKINQIKDGKI